MDITPTALISLLAAVDPAEPGVLDEYRAGVSNLRTTLGNATDNIPDVVFSRTLTVPASGSLTVTLKDFTIPADSSVAYKDSDGVDINLEKIYGIAIILRDNADSDATIPTQAEFDLGPLTANPDGGDSTGATQETITGIVENLGSACYFAWPQGLEVETAAAPGGASFIAFTQALAGSDASVEVVIIGKSE